MRAKFTTFQVSVSSDFCIVVENTENRKLMDEGLMMVHGFRKFFSLSWWGRHGGVEKPTLEEPGSKVKEHRKGPGQDTTPRDTPPVTYLLHPPTC